VSSVLDGDRLVSYRSGPKSHPRLEHLPVCDGDVHSPRESRLCCAKKAAEADVVVVLVAHRYGYAPPRELGGDGVHSITWLRSRPPDGGPGRSSCSWLIRQLLDRSREQDRLLDEPEKASEIAAAVTRLREFASTSRPTSPARLCSLTTWRRGDAALANHASTSTPVEQGRP